MKAWFDSLDSRERLLLILGAAALVLLLLYTMIWAPVMDNYKSLREGVAEQTKTLVWMKQAAGKVRALQKSAPGGTATGLGGRSLLAVVDQSARQGGLAGSIKRIEPGSNNKGVKIWFENAGFDEMILWLGQLTHSYQVETSVISIEPQGTGHVNARITLLEPGI